MAKQTSSGAQIIGQEDALRTPEDRMASCAWTGAYDVEGLDAFGNLDTIRHATPQGLVALHRAMFTGSNLVISIAGDINIDEATAVASSALSAIPAGAEPTYPERPEAKAATVKLAGDGEARAATVPSYRSPRAAWTLAAGLAVAASLSHTFVTYTPTTRNGLIIVGQTGATDVGRAFDEAKAVDLVHTGRSLARRWVYGQLWSPEATASFWGLLLVQSPALRPETLIENINSMTLDDFKEGLAAFSSGRAVCVEPSN